MAALPETSKQLATIDVPFDEPDEAALPQAGKPLDPDDESILVAYRDGTVLRPQKLRTGR